VDAQNFIKQAAEFGVTQRGQILATLLISVLDVLSLGQETCQGLVLTTSFYWAQSPQTRAWTERYAARMGKPPTEYNAAAYAGVTHWLKAVKAVGSLDGDAVTAKMHETPVNDFYNEDVRILQNGSVPHAMYLWQVKKREPEDHKWDVFRRLAVTPSPDGFAPADMFGCPLVKS
jgi:branched-chain amino acid transport system substrate-binding protein